MSTKWGLHYKRNFFNKKVVIITVLGLVLISTLLVYGFLKFGNNNDNNLGLNVFANEYSSDGLVYNLTIENNELFYTVVGYEGNNENLSIPSVYNNREVISISANAFANNLIIRNVIIADTIHTIGDRAFSDCSNLEQIILPNALTILGEESFLDCTSLQEIIFPQNLEEISYGAFQNCTSLTQLVIPANIINIGMGAFHSCGALETVSILSDSISIQNGVFRNSSSLTELHFNGKTFYADTYSFTGCTSLTDIYLYNNSQVVEAFSYIYQVPYTTNLPGWTNTWLEIYVPFSLLNDYQTTEPWDYYSSKLIGMDPLDNEDYEMILEGENAGKYMLTGYYRSDEDVIIPSSYQGIDITEIGPSALERNYSMKTLTMPNTIKVIHEKAFFECVALEQIDFSNQLKHIGISAFESNSLLTNLSLPVGIESLGDRIFATLGCRV